MIRAEGMPVDMAYFTADSRPPAQVCRDAVRSAEVFVGIVGFRTARRCAIVRNCLTRNWSSTRQVRRPTVSKRSMSNPQAHPHGTRPPVTQSMSGRMPCQLDPR